MRALLSWPSPTLLTLLLTPASPPLGPNLIASQRSHPQKPSYWGLKLQPVNLEECEYSIRSSNGGFMED